MQFSDPNEEQKLAFHRNCEAFIGVFVTSMRGDRSAIANVMAKGLVVSKEEGGMERKEVVERKEVMESSVDATQDELVRAVDEVDVDRVPNGVVPSSLPQSLRSDPTRVEQGDISRLYDVSGGVQRVQDGDLTQAQLIALHLKSYRNILEYELSDVQQLRRRFLRYFASVFIELVDLCYPDRGNTALVNLAVML